MRQFLKWLPLCAVLGLGACDKKGDDDGGLAESDKALFSLFDPVAFSGPTIPFPNDALFSGFRDPTLNVPLTVPGNPAAPQNALANAINLVDGFSTTASIFTDFLGQVDFSTAAAGILLIDTSTSPPTVLRPGIDFTIQPSTALAADPTGQVRPINTFRSRILIEPLRPLKPSTRYIVALTRAIRSTDGDAAIPSDYFRVVASGTPVNEQDAPVLAALTDAQRARLETIRSVLVRPIVQALGAAGIAEENLVLAWSFTTQSIGKTLQRLAATTTAQPIAAAFTGRTTQDINAALPPVANVHVGFLSVPYYLADTSTAPNAPLTNFWLADPARPDTGAAFLGQVPCGAFAAGVTLPDGQTAQPSLSTTTCFPDPIRRSDETVPLLVTVPNANSGRTRPANGWPVVIFQHGFTRNRTDMFAVAPALAAAGFVVVSIDLPLHGLTDPTSPLYGNQLFAGTPAAGLQAGERTFDLDLINNATRAPGPDGTRDPSGIHYLNLASLPTSRDNLRQAVADLIALKESVGNLNLDGDGATDDIDETQIRFLGHSGGAIAGIPFLAVSPDVGAATLAMPGGGLAKLLDGSGAFGDIVAAGLAASGIQEGTDTYETFLRFAQTLVDPADPVNYAVAASAAHPIHMIEVIDDAVVPNDTLARPDNPPIDDRIVLSSFLGGTDPLYQLMGLTVRGPITPPVSPPLVLLGAAARSNVVQFAIGEHSTILTPDSSAVAGPDATFAAVTQEMQRQTSVFLASNGTCLPIGTASCAP